MRTLRAFVVFVPMLSHFISSEFNYDVTARVQEKLLDFTGMISRATLIPVQMLKYGLLNDSLPTSFPRIALLPILNVYQNVMSSLYVCFSDGSFYLYGYSGTYFEYSAAESMNPNKLALLYFANADGSINSSAGNFTYSCKSRDWYSSAISKQSQIWSKPYPSFGTNAPTITLSHPVSCSFPYQRVIEKVGVLAADIYLSQINEYLIQSFAHSDRIVYIVDKYSLVLLGTSWNVSNTNVINYTNNLTLALDSEEPFVAAATSVLISKNWSPELLIFGQDHYLQSTLFTDTSESLAWYVVVLLPATGDADHLGPSSSYYYAVIALVVFTIFFCVSAGIITTYCWSYRVIQFTQPEFTLVVLAGSIVLSTYNLVSLGPNNSVNCAVRPYVFNFGFTLAFTPILMKCTKIYSAFVRSWRVNALMPRASHKLLTLSELVTGLVFFLAVDLVIIISCLYAGRASSTGGHKGSAPYAITVLSSAGAYQQLTYCGYHRNDPLFFTELAYKGILVACACFLTFLNRHVSDAVAGSRAVALIVYNCLVVSVIMVALTKHLSAPATIILSQTIGVTFCVCVACVALTLPPLYRVAVVGDKMAAAEVIDEMFHARTNAALADPLSPLGSHDQRQPKRSSSCEHFSNPNGISPAAVVPMVRRPKNAAAASLGPAASHNHLAVPRLPESLSSASSSLAPKISSPGLWMRRPQFSDASNSLNG